MDTRDLLPMGEVVATQRLRRVGAALLREPGADRGRTRSAGGQRTFQRSVLRRLAFIRAASNIGLTLEEIREELDRPARERTPTKADWQRISRHWRPRLDEQIAALERLRDGLDSCIGCGCLSLKRCAISNPRDVAAGSGEGAAYLPRLLRRDPLPRHRDATHP